MNHEESLEWLYNLQYIGIKLGLDNTKALLSELGNPHDKLKIIHVAGTNGKGSVCAFLTSILTEAGYKVGTYTSPHLRHFGERIAINGFPMTEQELTGSIQRVKKKVEKLDKEDVKCTFFETATAMAFDHFSRRKVDFAIMEVGMGGRLDSTNVSDPIISVITSIGLDHTQHLGDVIEDIAGEKAGIIKKGRPVVCGIRDVEALKVIENKARKMKANMIEVHDIHDAHNIETSIFGSTFKVTTPRSELADITIRLAGRHQIDNALIAIATVHELEKQGFEIPEEKLKKGLANTIWNGRLQVARTSPLVIVDGTHNPPGARALEEFVSRELAGKRKIGIIGMLEDKDHVGIVKALEPVLDDIIITAPSYHRALKPETLAKDISKDIEVCQTVDKAIDKGLARAGNSSKNMVLITGSIFTASDALAHLDQLRISEMMELMSEYYPVGAFPGKEVGENETTLGKRSGDAFDVLISTILSQRTRDENTHRASTALFDIYPTPEELANADPARVEELIRPAGFYKQKTRKIIETAREIVEKHGSEVPEDIDQLLELPGVGRKTANCVLVYGFNKPAMPVDTHVHRISNLIGLIKTREADHSELALIDLVPEEYWIDINRLMVRHGQVICKPINPQCHKCFMNHICDTGIYRLRDMK
ncbi:MAG: hypothetical protein KAS16_02340 [Thermoplasmata archaeon]|nr:hypothetical protein [Thermoplasmata archaeon]